MVCVCVGDVMNVVFSVCIVRRGAVGTRVWEVLMFRYAGVVCLCASYGSNQCCVLHDLQLLMLVSDARGNHMEEAYR